MAGWGSGLAAPSSSYFRVGRGRQPALIESATAQLDVRRTSVDDDWASGGRSRCSGDGGFCAVVRRCRLDAAPSSGSEFERARRSPRPPSLARRSVYRVRTAARAVSLESVRRLHSGFARLRCGARHPGRRLTAVGADGRTRVAVGRPCCIVPEGTAQPPNRVL